MTIAALSAGFAAAKFADSTRTKMGKYTGRLIGDVVLLFVIITSDEVGKEFHKQYPFLVGFLFAAVYTHHAPLILSVFEGKEGKEHPIVSSLIFQFGTLTVSIFFVLISPVIGFIIPAVWMLMLTVEKYDKQISMTLRDNQSANTHGRGPYHSMD